jgi:hypothetical protein
MFPIYDSSKSIFCSEGFGPYFGNCDLGLQGEPMNGKDNGYCRKSKNYNVGVDDQGRNLITGEEAKFTCAEIEVFRIVFI